MTFSNKGFEYQMYDYSKLNGRIIEKCGSKSNFSKKMNLSERSMSLKLNNKRRFTQPEIVKACEILEIPLNESASYFFVLVVQ